MQLFSGSTNLPLAKKIAKAAQIVLGVVELSQFPNKEARVWIREEKIAKEVAIVQSFAGNPNRAILEFMLLVDALKRSGAKDITAIIPWMGYCIQDKVFRKGEPLSARVIANIIEASGVDRVMTIDLHNDTIEGFFNVPVTHLSAVPLFLTLLRKKCNVDKGKHIVVAPDVGALKETTKIAHDLDLPIAVLNKKRDLQTGRVQIIGVDIHLGEDTIKQINEVDTAIIMDDFISTGGTLVQTAEYLKQQGVRHIVVAVTHHLYVPGVQEKLMNSEIDELYVTDSIVHQSVNENKKMQMKIVSVAELIAQEL